MKDGVVLYISHFKSIEMLSDEELGQLFRACMRYANGEEYFIPAHLSIAFNFMRLQIDNDTKRYEDKVEKRRLAGRKGGFAKAENQANQSDVANVANAKNTKQNKQKLANLANLANNNNNNNNNNSNNNSNNNNNNINLVCTENATDVAENKESALQKRKSDFEHSLIPFLGTYTSEQLREFADYWTEPNKSHTKMRYELERTWDTARRLAYWDRNSKPDRHTGGSNYKSSFEAVQEFYENQSKVIQL